MRRGPTSSLYRRLFGAYVALMVVAVGVLVLAPVTVSVPIAVTEVVVLLAGFVVLIVAYRALLRHALTPLEQLTALMGRVDPLHPGRRLETPARDDEVAALAQAFNAMLDRLEDERRDSARRALAAQEAERKRIARELHDEVGQVLTGLVLRSESLARRAPADLRPDLEDLREAARAGAEEVRQIAARLRPEALDDLGLQSALLALVAEVSRGATVQIDHALDRDLRLDPEGELVVYRVAQESLTNVVRHADATHATVTLRRTGSAVVLEVADDGVGLPPQAERSTAGIRGMRERALLAGGALEVSAASPGGTVVRLELPEAGA